MGDSFAGKAVDDGRQPGRLSRRRGRQGRLWVVVCVGALACPGCGGCHREEEIAKASPKPALPAVLPPSAGTDADGNPLWAPTSKPAVGSQPTPPPAPAGAPREGGTPLRPAVPRAIATRADRTDPGTAGGGAEAASRPTLPAVLSRSAGTDADGNPLWAPTPKRVQSGKTPGHMRSMAGQGAAAPQSARPAAFADWKLYDYLSARREGDPRLTAALGQLRQNVPDQQRAVDVLSELLDDAFDNPSAAPDADAALTEAVLAVLAGIDTASARQTVDRVLQRCFASDAPAAAEVVLRFLAEHPSADHDRLLLRVLVGGRPMGSSEQAIVAPENVRKQALELVKTSGSSSLRAQVAKVIVDPSTPADVRAFLEPAVKEPLPANLEALTVLYRSNWFDAGAHAAAEKFFLQCSSEALEDVMGIAARLPATAADSDWPCQAARCLWNPAFTGYLELRHREVESLAAGASVVVLECAMPLTTVRSRLRQSFERYWELGPAPLKAAGLAAQRPAIRACWWSSSRSCRVPAPRCGPPPRRPAAAPRRKRNRRRKRRPRRTPASRGGNSLEELILCECKQFKTAAIARFAASSPEGVPQDLVDVSDGAAGPPLLQDAARGRLSRGLAGGLGQKLTGVPLDAMQVRYFRFEEKARSTAVASYFRRRLNGWQGPPLRERDLAGQAAHGCGGRPNSLDRRLASPR